VQFHFGDYCLDVARRELRSGQALVAVEPQVFDLLVYLLRNRDRVVSKDDLIAAVWGGRTVSESTLTSRINAARKAVGDSGEQQNLIRTVRRKGIRFVVAVDESSGHPVTVAPVAAAPGLRQEIHFCTAADGVRLAYAVSGEGPPLVMAATWLTHLEHQWRSLAWQPWLEAFSREHTLLRYDSRGCGLSDRDAGDLSFETWVRDFECVVDAASFRRFSLLATCQGGPIAIEYAARHPERVNRLILYGTYALGRLRWDDRPKEVDKARVLLDLTALGWGRENHAFLQVWASHFQPGGTLEHLRSWSDQQRAATSPETAVRLLRIGWNADVRQAARKIKCPVLIVHPERDAVVPIDEGRLIATLIPGCRFVQLDSENHMPLADEPAWARLLDEMRRFLAEPTAEPAAGRNGLPLDELTPRERAVLEGIAEGLDNAEIAAALGLSVKTVRNHITRVFDKISVQHRYQAIVLAREAGLGMNSRLTSAR
jgi:pimeloyl-ACP methyl ester carboxylesterase/DNA-binding winged helix-turn-helix (wHTH) protein/DNA-binding CsgD family transcriptional regulator